MQRKPNPPRYRPLFLLVALACVGLFAAVSYKRARRLEIEGARPPAVEPVERSARASTQAVSFQLSGIFEVENRAETTPSVSISGRTDRDPAEIFQSDTAAMLELARKDLNFAPSTNAPAPEPSGDKIVVE